MSQPLVQGSYRLDHLARNVARRAVEHIEGRTGLPLWDRGLGAVIETAIAESGIPQEELTPVKFARMLGLLGPAPKPPRVKV